MNISQTMGCLVSENAGLLIQSLPCAELKYTISNMLFEAVGKDRWDLLRELVEKEIRLRAAAERYAR